MLILIITAITLACLCFKFGDWKNWNFYYPTIIYFVIGNLTHIILTNNKPLWLINDSVFTDVFADYFISFFIFPGIIILFLSNFPKKIIKQIIYLIVSALILSSLEAIAYFIDSINYYNGWTIMWSALFYFIMFPLLWLHFKRPLWVWPISLASGIIVLLIFKIPLGIFK